MERSNEDKPRSEAADWRYDYDDRINGNRYLCVIRCGVGIFVFQHERKLQVLIWN